MKKPPRLIQILDKEGFIAALQWIARDGFPLGRMDQFRLLRDVERQFENAKRLAKKRGDPRIAKLERLAVDRGVPEGEKAAARAAAERIKRQKLKNVETQDEARGWQYFLRMPSLWRVGK